MNLELDLARILKQQMDESGINSSRMDIHDLIVRYLEMLNRRVVPVRRSVHFSREIYASLGDLRCQADFFVDRATFYLLS